MTKKKETPLPPAKANIKPKILKQPEKNYFEVPNQLIDEFYRDIPTSALKIYLFLIRKTWGWQKEFDWITMSQFITETGMAKNTIVSALR